MLPWLYHCWPVAHRAASPAARAMRHAWQARPSVRHHVVGPVARRAPRVAAAAGRAVAGVAVATGTTLVCARLPGALWPPAYAAPVAGAYAPAAGYGGGFGWLGLPGYLGHGGGVLWPEWIGGPAPGDAPRAVSPGGGTTGAPPHVFPPGVPPGVGPGAVPPGVTVAAPHLPPEGPRDVPEPSGLAVALAGLAALVVARASRRVTPRNA